MSMKLNTRVLVQLCLIPFISGITKKPKEKQKVATFEHTKGAFKCLGGLLTEELVLTCCTCVSDISFTRPACDGTLGYDITALEPDNMTVTIGEQHHTPSAILLHPQCDIDGSFDYAIIKLSKKCSANLTDKKISVKNPFSCRTNNAQGAAVSSGPEQLCVLETEFSDWMSEPQKRKKITVKFVSSEYCWNGNETDPSFESKYCVKSFDNSPIYNAKGGSPVVCAGKLFGIVARKYAVAGRKYTPVNGLDGALAFVQQAIGDKGAPDEEYLIKNGLFKVRRRRKMKHLKKQINYKSYRLISCLQPRKARQTRH